MEMEHQNLTLGIYHFKQVARSEDFSLKITSSDVGHANLTQNTEPQTGKKTIHSRS